MAVKLPIYMDYHATTPVDSARGRGDAAVLHREHFGNAASRNHPVRLGGGRSVENARKQVADLIGANAKEIVFTSGATESDNLRSRASPRCTARRAITSSRASPSTRR
jgi:cysteine desulfurase